MVSPINELDGFVVYVPKLHDYTIKMSITKTGCRLSGEAVARLGTPEYSIVFFDRSGKRMMLQPAKKDTPNALKVSNAGGKKNTISAYGVFLMIMEITENDLDGLYTVEGYQPKTATQPCLIFDLSKIKRIKRSGHD